MKIPYSWINEYVDISDIAPEQLANILLNIGFEVEELIRPGKEIEKVVVGKILDIKKHVDADKLSVCMVDVGSEITTIVTGASNIAAGDVIPVALDGALLPGGKQIHAAPLRGIMSYGMMCSGSELGVDNLVIDGAEVDGILQLDKSLALGTDIREVLRLNETILDVSITANRPDCQSVYGLAREVAAAISRKVKPLNLKYKTVAAPFVPKVTVQNAAVCSRYTARVLSEVTIEPSPEWMRDRLRFSGIRPINNMVDITNYVLLEVGQPLHAFDARFVSNASIAVRGAYENEELVALDGNKYLLKEGMLLITDDEKPLAIAGVMGGEFSGVMPDTDTVILEAARFSRGSIRTTSRLLGLRSDSSARYEKGVDWQSVDVGRERALSLVYQLKAAKVTDATACADEIVPERKVIVTSAKQIGELLGIDVKSQVLIKILKALEFEVETTGDKLSVRIPLFREDVDNYTDLAEEFIRFYGYDNIESTLMKTASTTVGGMNETVKKINEIKNLMCGLGAYEITTYSFIPNKLHDKLNLPSDAPQRRVIEILNPLSEEYAVMRTQLAGNMLSTAALNLTRKNKQFRLFEIGRIYLADELPLKTLPREHEVLCMGFCGEFEDFYTLKDAVTTVANRYLAASYAISYGTSVYLHPGISADLSVNGKIIGSFGKVHPLVAKNFDLSEDLYIAELDLTEILSYGEKKVVFEPLPKFQAVDRDLAVIIKEELTIGDMLQTILSASPLCCEAKLFDIYRGEQIESGYKSVAFAIKLQSAQKTLADAEIQQEMDRIKTALSEKFEAKLR